MTSGPGCRPPGGPRAGPIPAWSYGVDGAFLRDLCRYWADEYDWRQHEGALNQFSQYRTRIDGAQLHFSHVRSPNPVPSRW